MGLPRPYATEPARKRTPTIRAVRRTLESGRTTGGEVEWLEAGIGSRRKVAMVTHPIRRCDVVRRKWMVPAAASDAMTTTTSHTTPDTKLIAQ